MVIIILLHYFAALFYQNIIEVNHFTSGLLLIYCNKQCTILMLNIILIYKYYYKYYRKLKINMFAESLIKIKTFHFH